MKQPDAIATRYVLYFNESLRGLSVGAPVTLLGLPAGEVTEVGLDIDPATAAHPGAGGGRGLPRAPHRAPGRRASGRRPAAWRRAQQQRHALFQQLVEQRGLRAQLRSGNLLTGPALRGPRLLPGRAQGARSTGASPSRCCPWCASTLPDLEAKLSGILAKLDKLPFDQIGADVTKALASLDGTLKDAGKLLNRVDTDVMPELKTTLEEARRMIATADGLLKTGVNGTLDQVNATLEELRRPLATADAVLKNADAVLYEHRRDAPRQERARPAGSARRPAGGRARRAVAARPDGLSRAPSRLAAPGQVMRRRRPASRPRAPSPSSSPAAPRPRRSSSR